LALDEVERVFIIFDKQNQNETVSTETELHRKSPIDLLSVPCDAVFKLGETGGERPDGSKTGARKAEVSTGDRKLEQETCDRKLEPKTGDWKNPEPSVGDRKNETGNRIPEPEKGRPEPGKPVEEEEGKGRAEENSKKKKVSAKFLVEKETDGKWLYCKIEGCHFWTRKQVRMSRHSKSHARSQCYKTISVRNLRIFVIS
jgi:hypothetical protein